MVIIDFFLRGGPTLSLMLATDFYLLKNCCFSIFTGDFGSYLEGEAGDSSFEARSFETYCSIDLRSSFGVISCACCLVSSLLASFFASFFFYYSALR